MVVGADKMVGSSLGCSVGTVWSVGSLLGERGIVGTERAIHLVGAHLQILFNAPRLGHIPFVFLTALADRESELRARRLGADDYVTKPIDFDMLDMIVNARLAGVARNEMWPKLAMLNDREIEALTWVARGKTSAQIADLIGLSKRTIDFHLDNARLKLGASTRTEAAIKAAAGKLIEP